MNSSPGQIVGATQVRRLGRRGEEPVSKQKTRRHEIEICRKRSQILAHGFRANPGLKFANALSITLPHEAHTFMYKQTVLLHLFFLAMHGESRDTIRH